MKPCSVNGTTVFIKITEILLIRFTNQMRRNSFVTPCGEKTDVNMFCYVHAL